MIQQPYYDSRVTKWVVKCEDGDKYFSDGETADDFYLLNAPRQRNIKPRTPDVSSSIMQEQTGARYLITDPKADIYLNRNKQ